jgi:hypothetical protein
MYRQLERSGFQPGQSPHLSKLLASTLPALHDLAERSAYLAPRLTGCDAGVVFRFELGALPRRDPLFFTVSQIQVRSLQTPQVPPSFAQCLQYLQFLQAWHGSEPVQVAAGGLRVRIAREAVRKRGTS